MTLAGHPGKRVLLVEDNVVTREMMSLVLAGEGYRVAVASNGADAHERLLHHQKPDLIVLDLRMPHMDGCAFYERWKQEQSLADIPVIICSGASDVAEKAHALGIATYL